MTLSDDLERIAAAAVVFAAADERLTGILAVELIDAGRVYLCAYASERGGPAWLALDAAAKPIDSRRVVGDAASLAALCEVADETAGGGDLPQLRARLAELRETEAPPGIVEAEEAAAALAATLLPAPHLATTDYLDLVGAAVRRLEQALGDGGTSPFAAAMQQAVPAVEGLAAEVERRYKGPLA